MMILNNLQILGGLPNKIINENNDKSKIQYVKRIYVFPYIEEFNDIDYQIDFLNIISSILKNEFNKNKIDIGSFNIFQLDLRINSVRNIFDEKYIDFFKEKVKKLDNNFYSDDDEFSYVCFNPYEKLDENHYIKI